jgi:hypothetical protein
LDGNSRGGREKIAWAEASLPYVEVKPNGTGVLVDDSAIAAVMLIEGDAVALPASPQRIACELSAL